MAPREDTTEPPGVFVEATESIRTARTRPEVRIEETAAPGRLAPYALAITADVVIDSEELATGRLVLLHDPAGHETWEGNFRLVTFARIELDHEMASDPLLTNVAWSWLLESLDARGADYLAPAGTVTRTTSDSFGAMADKPSDAQVEVRASWTPGDAALGAHLEAWTEMLCTAAGLPPLPQGVVAMPSGRNRRR